jgi:hypothetical protein
MFFTMVKSAQPLTEQQGSLRNLKEELQYRLMSLYLNNKEIVDFEEALRASQICSGCYYSTRW